MEGAGQALEARGSMLCYVPESGGTFRIRHISALSKPERFKPMKKTKFLAGVIFGRRATSGGSLKLAEYRSYVRAVPGLEAERNRPGSGHR